MKRMLFIVLLLIVQVICIKAGHWLVTTREIDNNTVIYDYGEYEPVIREYNNTYYYHYNALGDRDEYAKIYWQCDNNGYKLSSEKAFQFNSNVPNFISWQYLITDESDYDEIESPDIPDLVIPIVHNLKRSYRLNGETNIFTSSFSNVRLLNFGFFRGNTELKEIIGIENINLQDITSLRYAFTFCENLKKLDLSSFNTSNITDMGRMFQWCSSLESLDVSNFDTQNVTRMCERYYKLEGYYQELVEYSGGLFEGCSSLKKLNLGNFNTSKITDMNNMFRDCSSLTSLDLSSFDTSNVEDMSYMFCGCSSLKSLDLSSFDTSNVWDMSYMFCGCSSLKSLDLSNFVIPYSTGKMFFGCTGLDTLKISSSFNRLFYEDDCEGVGTKENPCVIIAPDDFDFETDTSGDWFLWKGGYFKLEDSKRYVTLRVTTDFGYITYCSYEPLDFSNSWDVKAYIVTDYNNGIVTLSQMTTTPPETGLLLKLGAGDYQFRFAQGGDEKDNMLKGVLKETTLKPTEGEYVNFVLANGNNGLGFYRLKDSGWLAAHRAYLQVPASAIANEAKFLTIKFEDEATTIDGIMIQEENAPYYDLQGVRHEGKPTKQGIYIQNGKKIVVKD